MAARRVWTTLVHAFRTPKQWNGTLRSGAQSHRQHWFRLRDHPQLLLLLPATGLLRSLSFSYSNYKAPQDTEPQKESLETDPPKSSVPKANALYDDMEIDEVLNLLRECMAESKSEDADATAKNTKLMWQLIGALMDKSKRGDGQPEATWLFFQLYEIADELVRASGDERGVKGSDLDAKDAPAFLTLGLRCFVFADSPGHERERAVVAKLDPGIEDSDYDEALKYFHMAQLLDSKVSVWNSVMLGKTYQRVGNRTVALFYLKHVMASPVITEDDTEAHREAEDLLTKLGVKLDKEKTDT